MKDAYYFPHFCNARHDRKIKRLRHDWGHEGYALYFMTLEVLREQSDYSYPTMDIDLLADEFDTTTSALQAVICDSKLFEIYKVDGEEYFKSPRLIEYMQPYLERSNKARQAAKSRWNANAMPEHNASNASKVKESKVKESKVNESKEKKSKLNLYQ